MRRRNSTPFLHIRLAAQAALSSAAIAALLLATPAVSRADLLGGNLGAGGSYDTAEGNPVGNAFDGNNYGEAASFLAAETGSVGRVELAVSCLFSGGCPDDFTVFIAADNSGQPNAPALESFTVSGAALGVFGNNNPLVTLDSVLKPILTMGDRYWVGVTSDLTDSIAWNFNSTGDTSDTAVSTDGGMSWFGPSGQTPGAFEVDSTPELNSVFLSSTVLLLLAAVKRFRRTPPAAPAREFR